MVEVLGGVSYVLLFFKYRGTSLQNNISEKNDQRLVKVDSSENMRKHEKVL